MSANSYKASIERQIAAIADLVGGINRSPAPSKTEATGVVKSEKEPPIFVPIAKVLDELRIVTGIVLQPEVTDAQGDIYDANVIREAAHDFLSRYHNGAKLGKQHNDFSKWGSRFALVESWIAPLDMAIGDKTVKSGSWVMTVKVLDDKVWKAVKDGKITGFSIGGKAKVKELTKQP